MADDLPEHEVGSGSISADLGLPDAETHLLKAQLVSRLADLIEERRLTQAQTARILGIIQPDVSRMLREHFRDYSVERLMRFLTAFDQVVTIEVRPKPTDRSEARLTVAGFR